MDAFDGILKLFSFGFSVQAESDYWNTHSDSYRSRVWSQILIGVPLFLVAIGFYLFTSNIVPGLFFIDYFCCCWAFNSAENLSEKGFFSENFSEFWLFGFCKGDDYLCGIVFGALGAIICTALMANLLFVPQLPSASAPQAVQTSHRTSQHASVPPVTQTSHHSAHHALVKPLHHLSKVNKG